MSASFSDLANVRVGEVERPKPVPLGHYVAQFTGPAKEHKAAKTGNIALRYPFRLTGPGDDVDTEALEAAGGIPDKEFTLDFWMSPDARYRFTEFAKAMGVSEDYNLIEAAEQLVSAGPFLIQVKHELGGDESMAADERPVFMRFDNPAPLK